MPTVIECNGHVNQQHLLTLSDLTSLLACRAFYFYTLKQQVWPVVADLQSDLRKLRIFLPAKEDIVGSQEALIRLQRVYKLDTDLLANGTIYGRHSESPLSAMDFWQLGKLALYGKDSVSPTATIRWLQKAVECQPDPEEQFPRTEAMIKLAYAYKRVRCQLSIRQNYHYSHFPQQQYLELGEQGLCFLCQKAGPRLQTVFSTFVFLCMFFSAFLFFFAV